MKHNPFLKQQNQSQSDSTNKSTCVKSIKSKTQLKLYLILMSLVIALSASAASSSNTKIVSNNVEYDLLISLPDKYDTAQTYSLVLALQPCMSAPTKDYLAALKPLTDSLNMIVISPDLSKTGNWMNDANFGVITTSIDSALSMYSINPESVFLTGMSCNGATTLQQGLKKMYPFKGIFPWDPYLPSVNPKIMDLNSDMPVTISVGTKDDYLNTTLAMYDSLKAHGAQVNLILVEGIAHTYSFANFGNEMIHSIYYLLNPNSVSIEYTEGTLPNLEMTNTDPAKKLEFKINGETGHEYEIKALSSNSSLLANPTVNYTATDGKITLEVTPTAGRSGKAIITLEVHEKGGTAYAMKAINVKVTKPAVTTTVTELKSVFEVYPNPASNRIFVKSEEQSLNVQISDLSGKVILNATCNQQSTIDISTLKKGVYLLNATGNKKYKTREIIVR